MDEKDFGQIIASTLNLGLSRIDDDKVFKLRTARLKAMDAYREPVVLFGLVTVLDQREAELADVEGERFVIIADDKGDMGEVGHWRTLVQLGI